MSVAVIGGGYAGMAAAVTLADRDIPVVVFEAAQQLGGRARRVVYNGATLDNGLHILIGAYRQTLALIRRVHPRPESALLKLPFDWHIKDHFRLRTAPLPAPLHVAVGLLFAQGAPWRERLAAARFIRAMQRTGFRLERDLPVSELLSRFHQGPAISRFLWEPLCVSALNTQPGSASAQVFLNVLRDGLNAERSASEIMVAREDLTALFPEPAADYVRARGGEVRLGHTVDTLMPGPGGHAISSRGVTEHYSDVICAVGPHQLRALTGALPAMADTSGIVERLAYEPIHTVYLQFEGPTPLPSPMIGLADGMAQWVFDRDAICGQRGLLAAVISAGGPHQALGQEALAQRVHADLQREFGPLPALTWQRVIAEKRATFACTVGLERPSTRTPLARFHLAGDYTASEYPATLEAAVASGIACANAVSGTA
jgi:squalene-associated FAD-dependent desaturase